MSEIQLIVDGVTVFEQDALSVGGNDTCPPPIPHYEPTLADDTVVLAQVRKAGTGVYFQARFADGSRQSVDLENVNVNGLASTYERTDKACKLSLAGSGNHYYTPAFLAGNHVYADNIHIGDLPEGWDSGRK